jgi:uncharacterized membrane protein (DUF2068 family)
LSKRPRKPHHRPPPEALDLRTSAAGLRTVAVFEAVKGIVVLALGLGLLSLLHKDVEEAAENALIHLHLNPEHRIGQAMIRAASTMSDSRLWSIAAGAAAYSVVRFVESYGLWNRRVWAEWFALLSGMLYLPIEIYKLSEKTNWLHILIFALNLAIFLYMLEIRVRAIRPLKTTPEGNVPS